MSEDFSVNRPFFKLFYANNKIVNPLTVDVPRSLPTTTKKRCLIVLPQRLLAPEEVEQIEKIMSACKLSPEQFDTVQGKENFEALPQSQQFKEIIWMGVKPSEYGFSQKIKDNIATPVANQTWISTFDISELMHNIQAKSLFWKQALQPHFA